MRCHLLLKTAALALLLWSSTCLACAWNDPASCLREVAQAIRSPDKATSPPADNQTDTAEAPCSYFDLGGCMRERARKQQEARDEAAYQSQLKTALNSLTGRDAGAWIVGSADAACRQAQFDMHSDQGHRCLADVAQQYEAFRRGLRTGSQKIASCREWAIAKGARWEAAQTDMRLDAGAEIVTPVMFSGEVESGANGTLTIRRYTDNACLSVSSHTLVINRASLRIGQEIRGYGLQTGKQMPAQVDGQHTRIPVIEAACLE